MKKEGDELRFRPGDAVAMASVILAALLMLGYFLLFNRQTGKTVARVYQDGRMIRELRPEEDVEFTVEGTYRNVITVKDGKIAITESDCPGQDCVHSGWIESAGRSIVCLPNRVEIRMEGAMEEDDVDAVVR